jgi:hypothetical protein
MPARHAPIEAYQSLKFSRRETSFQPGDLVRGKAAQRIPLDLVVVLPQHAGSEVCVRWMRSQVVLTFERPRELRGYEAKQTTRMLHLEDGQEDVLSRSGKFNHERKQYPFEALSLWGFEQPTPDKTCFRYEIKNSSGLRLEAVSWPDIGMEFVDIDIADRSHWTTHATPSHHAVQDMSAIKAFARSSDLIRTYLPAVTKHTASFSEFSVNIVLIARKFIG